MLFSRPFLLLKCYNTPPFLKVQWVGGFNTDMNAWQVLCSKQLKFCARQPKHYMFFKLVQPYPSLNYISLNTPYNLLLLQAFTVLKHNSDVIICGSEKTPVLKRGGLGLVSNFGFMLHKQFLKSFCPIYVTVLNQATNSCN